ncbi:MAG: FecR domain-containing protein [Leptospiraceae bacterium]|nr:FecR domain-containing protein [Leptospiraceae bacterium]
MLSIISLAACGPGDQKSAQNAAFLALQSEGEAWVLPDGKADAKKEASQGMLVFAADTIQTGKGSLDLQSRSGNALRIRENTTVTVESLVDQRGQAAVAVVLNLQQGSLFARAQKGQQTDEFTVKTPTAVASVRGTAFAVRYENGQPNVRVMEGSVAMQPRISSLEKMSSEALAKSPELQKLAELQRTEIIVETQKEASLDAKVSQTLQAINQELAEPGAGTAANLDLGDLSPESALEAKEMRRSAEDIMDEKTLVTVAAQEFDQLRQSVEKGEFDPSLLAELEGLRAEKRLEALQEIARMRMDAQANWQADYSKMATVVLRDGQQVYGEIVNRTAETLTIRDKQGLHNIPLAAIKSIE